MFWESTPLKIYSLYWQLFWNQVISKIDYIIDRYFHYTHLVFFPGMTTHVPRKHHLIYCQAVHWFQTTPMGFPLKDCMSNFLRLGWFQEWQQKTSGTQLTKTHPLTLWKGKVIFTSTKPFWGLKGKCVPLPPCSWFRIASPTCGDAFSRQSYLILLTCKGWNWWPW